MDDPSVSTRREALERVAARILKLGESRPLVVAVDGPDAAGKTTFADELGAVLSSTYRVVRASIDDYLLPAQQRYANGQSGATYFADSFDNEALKHRVAEFSADGGDGDVLIVDGVFLLRKELRDCWDYSVYVDANDEVRHARATSRDTHLGSPAEIMERYASRYEPGQAFYRSTDDPLARADVVIDNSIPDLPVVTFRSGKSIDLQ